MLDIGGIITCPEDYYSITFWFSVLTRCKTLSNCVPIMNSTNPRKHNTLPYRAVEETKVSRLKRRLLYSIFSFLAYIFSLSDGQSG